MGSYVPRPTIDGALAGFIRRGAGVFTLEGPSGAGKSAALVQALIEEIDQRPPRGRPFVRLVQLYGDEPPSLFARRLVQEASHLHLISYPQPERLRTLLEAMNLAVPGLGKLLSALVPEDLRPMHQAARDVLAALGQKAIDIEGSGPFVLAVDLLGGTVSQPMRDFFARLQDTLPASVVVLVAQPSGAQGLCHVRPECQRLLGPLSAEEAWALLRDRLPPSGPERERKRAELEAALVRGALLPGDVVQLAEARPGVKVGQSMAASFQQRFEDAVAEGGAAALAAADLCAWVAVAARPDAPLTAEVATRHLGLGAYQTSSGALTLWSLRRHELVQALCTTALGRLGSAPAPGDAAGAADLADAAGGPSLTEALTQGWPLLSRHAQARAGVLAALRRQGVLGIYLRRHLEDLRATLRAGLAAADGAERAAALQSGVQALRLLLALAAEGSAAGAEHRAGQGAAATLGQAVLLLGELEAPLWHAGWHRTFAELYDALRPGLVALGLDPREAAPTLWFRRARARVQAVDFAGGAGAELAPIELPLAEQELSALLVLSEEGVLRARLALGLPKSGDEAHRLVEELPLKARQARGYARILQLLLSPVDGADEVVWRAALDDILVALAHFASPSERLAQTLTILGDAYSAAAQRGQGSADELAVLHYHRAVSVARALSEPPLFALGVIYRSLGAHHARCQRPGDAARANAQARRYLLRSPDAAMGSLLAGLLPG